ncbi:MAG: peptidoglycan-associated outer rane lipoprotein [Myxococcales bacterium]|nr:peptidoglycan-associated outer rane lipoprotein [Myxococcales bacterium]
MKTTTLALVLAAVVGCSHDKAKVATTTPTPVTSQPGPTKAGLEPQVTEDQKVSPTLAISGDLATMCGIKAAAQTNAKFDYDKDELTSEDRNVLDQLATCLTNGALKGKAVALIGRADPRGTEEYNLGLGSRRAHTVGQYLGRLGVLEPQLAVTTRGALDASGTDESGWAQDRRVDVQLKVN